MSEGGTPDWWRDLLDRGEEVIPLLPAGARPPRPAVAEPPKSGILVLDKPAGLTSHDLVQRVRRAADERRVGHAGTLDPMATGVLVVCLGSATRVVEELQGGVKRYDAEVTFGRTTDTYDAEGTTTHEADAASLGRSEVEQALEAFRGDIDQVPPMYSAVHHEGRKLYELAREGKAVPREPRRVTVFELTCTAWDPPTATLSIAASKGTYVRTIAHDLGQALGVGAHLTRLRRTAVGPFDIRAAASVEDMEAAFRGGWWPRLLHALDAALLDYDALVVGSDVEADLREGRQVASPEPGPAKTPLVRVYNRTGVFVGLVEWDAVTGRWQPDRIFPPAG